MATKATKPMSADEGDRADRQPLFSEEHRASEKRRDAQLVMKVESVKDVTNESHPLKKQTMPVTMSATHEPATPKGAL